MPFSDFFGDQLIEKFKHQERQKSLSHYAVNIFRRHVIVSAARRERVSATALLKYFVIIK